MATSFRGDELEAQLLALGVEAGGVLLVHTSFRAVRPVEGGPLGLIRALRSVLGPEGTLVMPTMTDGESVFDPRSTPTVDMGITAETFWRQAGVVRSTHPGGSFAAAGPHASEICAPQPLAPPHGPDSPPGRVHALDGQVLLLAETDHCCRGFTRMDAWHDARGLQREGKIGNADAKLARARDVVAIAVEQLTKKPLVFLCPPGEACEECDAARASAVA